MRRLDARKGARMACVSLVLGLTGCEGLSVSDDPEGRWVDLFDGQTLEGWTQLNGTAPYAVVNGAIRGSNVLDSPNSFLATDTDYEDFVLEFQARSDGFGNSGVQFRTELAPDERSGLIGYQLEIDPTDRRFTGGIYHESAHVWRHTMARNPECRAAYHHGEWNDFRIEAVGQTVATWVNGVACAHVVGDHHSDGFIALQIHDIGRNEALVGNFTEWRDLRLLANPRDADLWLDRRFALIEGWLVDEISASEALRGWRRVDLTDGSASLDVPGDAFELVIDVRVEGAADGQLSYAYSNGARQCAGRYQIANDAVLGETRPANGLLGSFPGRIAAENLSEPGYGKRAYSGDMWNRVRLIVMPGRVEHWLNGDQVVGYESCDPDVSDMEASTDPAPGVRLTIEAGIIETRSAKVRAISD